MYCKNVIVIRCSFSLIYFRLYILYVVNECKYVLQYTNKKLLKKKEKRCLSHEPTAVVQWPSIVPKY